MKYQWLNYTKLCVNSYAGVDERGKVVAEASPWASPF